jgi:hypothetical protein
MYYLFALRRRGAQPRAARGFPDLALRFGRLVGWSDSSAQNRGLA